MVVCRKEGIMSCLFRGPGTWKRESIREAVVEEDGGASCEG